jgi:hypothetical protein
MEKAKAFPGVWTFWDGNSGNIPARRAKKTKEGKDEG